MEKQRKKSGLVPLVLSTLYPILLLQFSSQVYMFLGICDIEMVSFEGLVTIAFWGGTTSVLQAELAACNIWFSYKTSHNFDMSQSSRFSTGTHWTFLYPHTAFLSIPNHYYSLSSSQYRHPSFQVILFVEEPHSAWYGVKESLWYPHQYTVWTELVLLNYRLPRHLPLLWSRLKDKGPLKWWVARLFEEPQIIDGQNLEIHWMAPLLVDHPWNHWPKSQSLLGLIMFQYLVTEKSSDQFLFPCLFLLTPAEP